MSCLAITPTRFARVARFDDDACLVSGMIRDDEEAWRSFYARYGALVARSVRGITRRFWRIAGACDAQDVVGIFYLSLVANDKRKLRSFDPARGYRFASWIRVLATHAAYDYLRVAGRDPIKEELAAAEDVPSESPDAFARMSREEDLAAVAHHLERFSPRDRMFTKLHLVEGLDAPRVAARMNVSVKTVYSKKNKIVSRLAAAIAKHG